MITFVAFRTPRKENNKKQIDEKGGTPKDSLDFGFENSEAIILWIGRLQ